MNSALRHLRATGAHAVPAIPERLDDLDWPELLASLDEGGFARVPRLLEAAECAQLAVLYDHTARFRSRVIMSRHGFGRGEYQYFDHPLPEVVRQLRTGLYERLAPQANLWHEQLGRQTRFPDQHADFLAQCRAAGQARPTPLLLRYGAGDFNCLHQDLYGPLVFPLQMAVLLSQPDVDFTGGEFVLSEQRPRQQSRVEVVPLSCGDAVIFTVNERPVRGHRGLYRVRIRHGVSRVRAGLRHTLGVILHDAA